MILTVAVGMVAACTSDGRSDAGRIATTTRTSARSTPSAYPTKKLSATKKLGTEKPSALQTLIAKLPRFDAAPTAVPVRMTNGLAAPIFYRMPTKAPVAFLTIDDGIVQMPQDLAVMKAAHIRFTMFLIGPVAAKNPPFFKHLVSDGGVIEDHTLTHPDLRGRTEAFQKHEICGARTVLTHTFGRAPELFRPPFGDYDSTTLKIVHDCGLRSAFYWSETVRNGKVFYQTSIHKIRPGDIILMHFRSTFPADVLAALTAIHRAGLTPALLENYVPQTAKPQSSPAGFQPASAR